MVPRFESALLAAAVVLVADSVPTFNVGAFCRKIAAMAHPFMRKEQEARDQVVQQWTQFPAADRRDARNLREKDEGTSGASPPLQRPACSSPFAVMPGV